jgi:pantoate--beta-alanine ligase
MILFKKAGDLHNYVETQRKEGRQQAFVPTMGALHKGHISLIEAAKKRARLVISSIFINPTQFNDPGDFKKYPVTIENDIAMLDEAGCDVLFIPSVEEIYPGGISNQPVYDLGNLENLLEGKFRPGHFQGVCWVVQRLLEIVQPDQLYMGQKDYQQCMVIRRLIGLMDKESQIELVICPTLREPTGLAMSSRNMRLDASEHQKAQTIYKCLSYIKDHIVKGDINPLKMAACSLLDEQSFRVDYVEIADANDLQPVEEWDGNRKIVALVAAFLGEVRLIDNMVLN